jgi:hypothetical protein
METTMPIPRRLSPICLLFAIPIIAFTFPFAARAAGPNGDAFLGYSRLGTDAFYPNVGGLNGWEGAVHFKMKPFLGVDGDVAHYGLGAGSSIPRTTTVLVGPRLTVGAAGVRLFVHALAGGEHSSNNSSISGGAFAVALGGGVDVRIVPLFAWRAAVDYLDAPTRSPGTGTHGRFSTGLVFRF